MDVQYSTVLMMFGEVAAQLDMVRKMVKLWAECATRWRRPVMSCPANTYSGCDSTHRSWYQCVMGEPGAVVSHRCTMLREGTHDNTKGGSQGLTPATPWTEHSNE